MALTDELLVRSITDVLDTTKSAPAEAKRTRVMVKLPRRIFAYWFGENPMNEVRKNAFASLCSKSGVEVILIGEEEVHQWANPSVPLHPSFPLLSAIHKADYMRTYMMHFHGGGYSDIKITTGSWLPSFETVDAESLLGSGYREVGRFGVATLGVDPSKGRWQPFNPNWLKWRWLQLHYRRLLGNGAYIFQPGTVFTVKWLTELHRRLDLKLPDLKKNPARVPKERPGLVYDGIISEYPITWSYLLADIFHPLCLKYSSLLNYDLPHPIFEHYQ